MFEKLTGNRLPDEISGGESSSIFVKRYDRGGMSRGHISLEFWSESLKGVRGVIRQKGNMGKDDHKIDADDRSVFDVLNERKYTVDYFQREYSWEQKHVEQLVTDLTSTFLNEYNEGDPRATVEQ